MGCGAKGTNPRHWRAAEELARMQRGEIRVRGRCDREKMWVSGCFVRGGCWVMVGGGAGAGWGSGERLGRRVRATCANTYTAHLPTTSNRADPPTQPAGTHRSTTQPHTPPVTPTPFAPTSHKKPVTRHARPLSHDRTDLHRPSHSTYTSRRGLENSHA